MATTKVDLASRALNLLGEKAITSFDEATAPAAVASSLYETVIGAALSCHRWRFASKVVELAKLDETPGDESSWVYIDQLPADLIVIHHIDAGHKYEIYRKKLNSNSTPVNLDYGYRPDEEDWPAYFTKFILYQLAADFCIAVTESTTKLENYVLLADNELKRARAIDSHQRPSIGIIDEAGLIRRRFS